MRLVIAEKPSVAKAIRPLVPDDVRVTYCFGHLLQMADPKAYDARWSKWSVQELPIRVTDWKMVPMESARRQLNIIGDLLREANEVIHAGDPDREGQLLVDEVLDYFGWTGPTRRLLVTATDPDTVRKAWKRLGNNADYQNLRRAAECRQRADWLVGMNMTRAVTRLLSTDALVSIGRVQTPTLALVVRRHQAIHGFKVENFWTFRATLSLSGDRMLELKCEPDPRIVDERQASALAKMVKGEDMPLVVKVEAKKRRSPLPYHLGDFQKAAERHFGWSLSEALAALQLAYEAKLTSYPRVDCRYLPSEQKGDALPIAAKVASALKVPAAIMGQLSAKDRVYDSSKVEVHHGIIPTGVAPGSDAPLDAVKAWKLVALHFLRTLMDDECYQQTSVTAIVQTSAEAPYGQLTFSRKGEIHVDAGVPWKRLDIDTWLPPVNAKKKKKAPMAAPLPPLTDGEHATCTTCRRHRGKTTPPDPYTESSLAEDMSSAAKFATDPKVKAILKETAGIGTPATQANIVATLIKRGFIAKVRGKTLDATALGIAIIKAIPAHLADPALTAAWEQALDQTAKGTYDPAQFMQRVDTLIDRQLGKIKEARQRGVRINAPATKANKGQPKARPATKHPPRKKPSATRNRPTNDGFL